MSQLTLDCQGLPCPQPVLRCKELIEKDAPAAMEVTVDNEAAQGNVSRFLAAQGYEVSVSQGDSAWTLSATRTGDAGKAEMDCDCAPMSDAEMAKMGSRICVFLTADTIGRGDDGLGAKLMGNFLATLPELGSELWRLVLVNSAVKLATDDSPAIDSLTKIEAMGVDILVCGTCLEHYKLLDKRSVGQTTNMLDVVTSLQVATKVIKP